MLPKVSIIMNCHNGEKYLKKSISSVINQTYKNWELIFWDNKSTDRSEKIFKDFKDKRLRYFKSKNYLNFIKQEIKQLRNAEENSLRF